MPPVNSSYSKVVLLGAAAAIVCIGFAGLAWAWLPGALAWIAAALLVVAFLGFAALVAGARIAASRTADIAAGRTDLFLRLNRGRTVEALSRVDGFRAGALRRFFARRFLGHDFLVGDEVVVPDFETIAATLDATGRTGGLPFMDEMRGWCGKRARVYRVVDKIYDFGRTKRLRRIERCVLLAGMRCDGAAHGGCQAACYVIWRTEWLARPGDSQRPATPKRAVAVPVGRAGPEGFVYECQYTDVHAASRPIGDWDAGKELLPLLGGNVAFPAFAVAMLLRWLNLVQRLRGGVGFPQMPERLGLPSAPDVQSLEVGDRVTVRPLPEIARTLNQFNKNKGLWFDRDMIKLCGQRRRVLARVDRIIDDATGLMRPMKTPCIVLEDAEYSGELQSFASQCDHFYWRESWLRKDLP